MQTARRRTKSFLQPTGLSGKKMLTVAWQSFWVERRGIAATLVFGRQLQHISLCSGRPVNRALPSTFVPISRSSLCKPANPDRIRVLIVAL